MEGLGRPTRRCIPGYPGCRAKSGLARIRVIHLGPERPLGLRTRGVVRRKPTATSSATESRPADGRRRILRHR
jgi:hypothetical protein